MAEVTPSVKIKVDPFMEKSWQRVQSRKRMERYEFWRKSAYPPFDIEPMRYERSRLIKEMTPEERALRKQWVLDQTIRHPKRHIPELQQYNIFRRIYRAPLNVFESALAKATSPYTADLARRIIGKWGIGILASYVLYYNLKYHQNHWTREGGFVVTSLKPEVYGPNSLYEYEEKHYSDFYDRGFKSRKALLYKE